MLRAGLRISVVSFTWTLVAGAWAIALGATSNSLTLIAFGAIGLLDAVGSSALIAHFRHALRHEAISERHERLALRIVTLGMATVGVGTFIDSIVRLAAHGSARSSAGGVVLASVSLVALSVLARRKQAIARRVPSNALHADGWLSAVGAVLAGVTLVGSGLTAAFGWWWLDPVAAMVIGGAAFLLSTRLASADSS